MRNSSPFPPNQSFTPSRAPRASWVQSRLIKRRTSASRPAEASCDILPPRWLSRRCLGGAGRWLVRFPRHAQFADYPAHRARRGRLTPPKTERGSFPTKQACRKTAALGFPPPAGVSPLSIERDDAAHDLPLLRRTIPPRAAYASLRLFSRQVGSTRTLRGRPKRARESFPASGDIDRTLPRTMTGHGAARCGFTSAAGL